MEKKLAAMPFGREMLLRQLLHVVQTHFEHDRNLRLEFSMVILWNMKSQNLNLSLPSSFDPDLVYISLNNIHTIKQCITCDQSRFTRKYATLGFRLQ